METCLEMFVFLSHEISIDFQNNIFFGFVKMKFIYASASAQT